MQRCIFKHSNPRSNMKLKTFILVMLVSAFGCTDIIEQDISKATVTVITPTNGLNSTSAQILIKWEETKGAESYNLQIVKPSFASLKQFLLDTNVKSTSFIYSFSSGTYQLRIRAQNNGSRGDYTYVSFSVDSTLTFSDQYVIKRFPLDTLTNVSKQLFKWDPVQDARDYRLEVIQTDGTNKYVYASIPSDTITLTLADGIYACKLRAQNDQGTTPYINFNLRVDTQIPGASTLETPGSNVVVTSPVQFTWTRPANTGSAIRDTLFITKDSTFATTLFKKGSSVSSYTLKDSLSLGKYYWRVRSYDAAGNTGTYSNKSAFVK